jgi:hypothetical protein
VRRLVPDVHQHSRQTCVAGAIRSAFGMENRFAQSMGVQKECSRAEYCASLPNAQVSHTVQLLLREVA